MRRFAFPIVAVGILLFAALVWFAGSNSAFSNPLVPGTIEPIAEVTREISETTLPYPMPSTSVPVTSEIPTIEYIQQSLAKFNIVFERREPAPNPEGKLPLTLDEALGAARNSNIGGVFEFVSKTGGYLGEMTDVTLQESAREGGDVNKNFASPHLIWFIILIPPEITPVTETAVMEGEAKNLYVLIDAYSGKYLGTMQFGQ